MGFRGTRRSARNLGVADLLGMAVGTFWRISFVGWAHLARCMEYGVSRPKGRTVGFVEDLGF